MKNGLFVVQRRKNGFDELKLFLGGRRGFKRQDI